MIRYALKCEDGHSFESWFQSAAAYDALALGGHLACAVCGSKNVTKSMMAPSMMAARQAGAEVTRAGPAAPTPPAKPDADIKQALAALRAQVEKNADYVGREFASEARAMHDGEAPARSIWGEARADEARALIDDGVPVAPLPFKPRQKMQ